MLLKETHEKSPLDILLYISLRDPLTLYAVIWNSFPFRARDEIVVVP